jgi:DNA-binding MarR family transcriptional regulator
MTDQQQGATLAPVKLKYLDFLLAVHKARQSHQKPLLIPPDEQRLLEIIAVRYAMHQPLSMMQALELRDELFLSPSAVSRKIDKLRDAELIRVVVDMADRRVKFIEPAEKALAHFEHLGTLMPASTLG